VYTIALLRSHPDRLLKNLEINLAAWANWDTITALAKYRAVGEMLWKLLHGVENLATNVNPCHMGDTLNQLLLLDFTATCVHLHIILSERPKYQEFLARRGEEAQHLLNLLQELLDYPHLYDDLRCPFTNALLKLSEKSGLYPECLTLKGVQRLGRPVAAGTFGDVWKGIIRGESVAIKVLRIYDEIDVEKHLKEFTKEAIVWRQLSHCNILPFYGVYHVENNSPTVCLVSPWMENGSLPKFLSRFPNTDRISLVGRY